MLNSSSLLLTACAAALVSSPSPSAAQQAAAPTAVIPLEPYAGESNLRVIHAHVGGKDRLFLFDTGEGVSMVTPKLVAAIGCKPWGQVTGFRLTGQRIDAPRCDGVTFGVGGVELGAPTAIVFDVMSLFPAAMLPTLPTLDGSIGLDIFAGRQITLEFAKRKLIVESAASFASRIRTGTEIPVRLVRDVQGLALTVDVGVPTRSGTAWMELDSGGGGMFIIGKHAAGALGLDSASTDVQSVTFTLAGKIPVTAPARVLKDMIMDGNINVPFLSRWDVTLDLAAGRMWIAPATK